MLIATGLAVALASALPAEALPASLPPVIVSVVEAPDVPGAIVTHLLAEAAEIWRAAGVAPSQIRERRTLEPSCHRGCG